ncbi:MAG: ABC-type multidrug transport system ATPase subunit [Cognaticolwellia sp.]|jgi:ABC-type multidrug transport system ATPase subunit
MLSEPLEYKLGFIETCYAKRYSCEHLSKRYKDAVAVNHINFAIQKGYCFGLLGPKGAGKTTTIETMKGIIKVSKGQVLYYAKPLMSKYFKKLVF